MSIEILEIGPDRLAEYATVPSRFMVTSMFQVERIEAGLGGLLLKEVQVDSPYLKDYDSYGELPTDWPNRFDVSKWGFFLAVEQGQPVGAATMAYSTPDLFMLESRQDLSVLWDLRVASRGRGAGIQLFHYAAQWSRQRACRQMKIETQNVNVPACRFYQRMGARLGEIRCFGYAAVPAVADEIMLCWYLDL
jgi:GNAT superfamily N-acetyltransferase